MVNIYIRLQICIVILRMKYYIIYYISLTIPKCKLISIVDKATVINDIKVGKYRKIVADELGVGLSTIVGWMKDEKKIIENSKIINS